MAEEQQEINMFGIENYVAPSDAQGEGSVRQEIVIDIHVRTLKLAIDELTDGLIPEAEEGSKGLAVRVVWSRGKKEAKTQYRYLSRDKDTQQFDEKIQINTVLDLNPETFMPIKEKNSRLAIALNRNYGYMELAEVQFDMADFKYGRYNGQRLFLQQVGTNEKYNFKSGEAYLEIGIKGTRADGLVMQRMSLIKSKITDTIKKQMQFGDEAGSPSAMSPSTSPVRERNSPSLGGGDNGAVFQREIEALKREKSQLNAQLSAAHSAQLQANTQLKNLEEELLVKKDVERELADVQDQYAMEVRNKTTAQGPDGEGGAVQDEEYEKLKQRFSDNQTFMLSLYDFERFDCTYLSEAAPFLKAKPAPPLKPAAGKGSKDVKKPSAAPAKAPAAAKAPASAKKPAAAPKPTASATSKGSSKKGKK